MSSTTSSADLSKAQTDRKISPAQIHPTASRSFGASDLVVGKTSGDSVQGPTGELETPLDVLCRVAAAAGLEKKVTSYSVRRGSKSFMESECALAHAYS